MHTAGPWQIKSEYEPLTIIGNVDGPDDGQYHYTVICEVEPTLFPDENAANARLIASAPALRAALELCVRELNVVKDGHTGGVPNSISAMIPEAIEAARRALEA